MMARRKREQPPQQDNTVQYIRGVIVYLCIVALFGSVILLVQAGMEEKRVLYKITSLAREKKQLLEDVRKLDIQISRLESYERISALAEEHLTHLKPPQHPAINIAVAGLLEESQFSKQKKTGIEPRGWFNDLRKEWRGMEANVQDYLNKLLD